MLKLILAFVIVFVYAASEAEGRVICKSVNCDSLGYKYNRCKVPGSRYVISVKVIKKKSKSPCTHRESFGSYVGDIWVDDGCRATFRVCYYPGTSKDVSCSSKGYKKTTCYIGSGSTFRTLLRHDSSSPCIHRHSYGMIGSYLYVDHGCRAVFRIYFSS